MKINYLIDRVINGESVSVVINELCKGKKKKKKYIDEMSQKEKDKLPDSAFIFPEERSWPIHDLKHAKIALIWATWPQHKDVAARVKKEVYKRYPELKE